MSREAGELNLSYFGKPKNINTKKDDSLVTETDKQSEILVRDRISEVFPEHGILGEEFGIKESDTGYYWCIDPLDGTSNFVRGIPVFAVSIALLYNNEPVVGVVYDPVNNNLFSAFKGGGTFLNNVPISTIDKPLQKKLLFAVQSDYTEGIPRHMNLILKNAKIRSFGAASLHICYVAAGWLDCYVDQKSSLWDIAAGSLILTEAGGIISNTEGINLYPLKDNIATYTERKVHCIGAKNGTHQRVLNEFFSL
ncbi:MAG: inositol monophosphatase [Planctomycetes bacterium]|nr:inositol monophosphatase [Planctomycetota bacterium]